jgi:hypothetical protein
MPQPTARTVALVSDQQEGDAFDRENEGQIHAGEVRNESDRHEEEALREIRILCHRLFREEDAGQFGQDEQARTVDESEFPEFAGAHLEHGQEEQREE